jgi:hypothetical protein
MPPVDVPGGSADFSADPASDLRRPDTIRSKWTSISFDRAEYRFVWPGLNIGGGSKRNGGLDPHPNSKAAGEEANRPTALP